MNLFSKFKRKMLEHISNLAEQYCVHFYCVPTLFSAYTFLRVNIVFCLHKQKTSLLGCYSGTKITPGSGLSGGPRRAYRVGFWYFLCRKQKVVKLHAKSGARRDHLNSQEGPKVGPGALFGRAFLSPSYLLYMKASQLFNNQQNWVSEIR